MRRRYGTYTAYSIACAIVWAVILAVVSTAGDAASRHTFLLVCGGWAIGWLSGDDRQGRVPATEAAYSAIDTGVIAASPLNTLHRLGNERNRPFRSPQSCVRGGT